MKGLLLSASHYNHTTDQGLLLSARLGLGGKLGLVDRTRA